MNKTYGRINWENYPSDETPLNESNLNKIDVATDEIDNRVITLDTTKATKEEVSTLVQDVTFEEKTGIITITKKNGSKITIDTQMEKIAVNFSYNAETQQIILTLIDGTKQYIDLTALITQYEFLDSDTVAFSIDSAGKVSAIVKEASIQEKHLQPNYLADIKVEVAKAQASQSAAAKSESNAKASETAAATSESNAAASADRAQNYAVADTDSAKYYYEQARRISESFSGALRPMGTVTFANLPALSEADGGSMYNISDQFTTTAEFKEGAGNTIPAGANVYKTEDGKWDVLAGTPVTGVKGSAESEYRRGNVNITAENVGLGNVDNTADSAKSVKYAASAGNVNWNGVTDTPSTYPPSDGSNNYVKVFNSSNVNSSDNLTVNDLADQGFAAAMIAATEDSPIGSGWFHALNLGWDNSKNNWVSQIALGTQPNDGLYYRTSEASIVGKPWKRVLDSSNYTNYALKNENLSNVDLNNVTTTGIYHLTGNLTNSPLSCNATLFVDFSVGTPYQIFIPDYAYVMYKRTYSNSAWGSWVYLNDYIPISGTASLAGSIVPNEDVGMELGDESHRFTNIYSSNVTTDTIQFNNYDNSGNTIYYGGNDSANGNGGGLNNLVIRSWWGVSFTSTCAGGRYGGKNQTAVGIDCREGIVKAYNFAGLINGHSVNADVPSDAKFTDTKGRYIGTTVTKPQDKTEMYITYLSSGYIVMAGKTVSKSYAMNTQYGNAFWAPFTIYLPPNIVKNIDSVNITPFAETGLISASINGYTSEQITGFVWSPQNETKSISFHVTVHGRA